MHHSYNCNHSSLNRYQYKGDWIEVFLDADKDGSRILYTALIELPNQGGVVTGHSYDSREEAEFTAEQLINSWN